MVGGGGEAREAQGRRSRGKGTWRVKCREAGALLLCKGLRVRSREEGVREREGRGTKRTPSPRQRNLTSGN